MILASWSLPGKHLQGFLGNLGVLLGRLGATLRRRDAFLKCHGALCERCRAGSFLVAPEAPVIPRWRLGARIPTHPPPGFFLRSSFWAFVRLSWAVLALSWDLLEVSWAVLGRSLGPLGPSSTP